MSLQPTVFMDLDEFIPQPPKRNRCREDPLALDDIIIKEEPLDESLNELSKSPVEQSFEHVEFIDMGPPQIKLEGFEATPVQTSTYHDPLAPENFEVKIENYEVLDNADTERVSKMHDGNTCESGSFLSSIFNLKKISLSRLKLTEQPSHSNNFTSVSIESTSNLTDTNQLDNINSVNTIVDLDSSNTVSKNIALPMNSLNNDTSNPNLTTTSIGPIEQSLVNSDSLNLSGQNNLLIMPANINDISSAIELYDSSENSRDNCDSSVYNEEREKNDNISNNDSIVSNNEKNTNLSVSKRRGQSKPDTPQSGKRRKVSLDSQINYDKPSNSCRRSRNSLLSALDNNIEPESFKAILEKLLIPENEISIECSKDESETSMNGVKCKRKSKFENSSNNKMSTKIIKSVIGKAKIKSKNVICPSNDVQLVEIPRHIYPIKQCTVVLERLNLSKTNITSSYNVNPQKKNKCIDNISYKESKLLSLQLYKEIPNESTKKLKENGFIKSKAVALKGSKKCTDEFISHDNLSENVFSNSANEVTNKNNRKKRYKNIRIENSNPEIKLNLRTRSSKNYVDYEENEDLSGYENLNENMKSVKRTSTQIIKKKKVIKTKGSNHNKARKKFNVNKAKRVKKSRSKDVGFIDREILNATVNNDDSEKNSSVYMNNMHENDEFSDTYHDKSESDVDEPDDDKDPDWLENYSDDISGFESENVGTTELLTCEIENTVISEVKPIFIINLKEDGKHKVIKNQKVMTQVKNILNKDFKSLFDGVDFRSTLQPHFKKIIDSILKDVGISFSQSTEDGKEILKCLFCNYLTVIERRFVKHFWLHVARYRCPYCRYENECSIRIKRHMTKHGIRLSFNCNICSFVTDDKYKLKEHKKLNHDDPRPFKCTQCDFKAPNKCKLNCHIKNRHHLKDFICDICKFEFSEKHYLVRHMKCHDDKVQKYVCRICGYRAKRLINLKNNSLLRGKDDLIKHMMDVHNEKLFNCNLCNYSSNENYNLQHHIKTVHDKIFSLSCDKCNFKTSCKTQLKVHINNVHNKIKAFVCHICNKKIGRKNDLDYHILEVHEKSTIYNCEYCSYTTARKGDLKSHKTVWHFPNNKTYKCFYCSFSGLCKKSIRNHISRKHDIKKPYFCIYCKFKTTTEESLEEHITRHSKQKPFKCPHCSYMTKRKNNLKQHLLGKHEKTKPFVCYYCKWGSYRKDHIKRHIWGRHKFGKYTTDIPIYNRDNVGQLNEHELRRQMYLEIGRRKLTQLPVKQSQSNLSNEMHLSQEQENLLSDIEIQEYVLQYGAQNKEIEQEIHLQDATRSNAIQEVLQGQEIEKDVAQSNLSDEIHMPQDQENILDTEIQEYVLRYRGQSKEIEQEIHLQDATRSTEIQQDVLQGREIQQDATRSNAIQEVLQGQEIQQDMTMSIEIQQDVLQGQEDQQDVIRSIEIQQDVLQGQEIQQDATRSVEIQLDLLQGQKIE